MLINFTKWCEEQNLKLPKIEEKTHRSGIRGQYPDAYAGRGYAYPDQYWTPISASAILDLKNARKFTKSVPDKTGNTSVK